jgi:predicted transglutaminase-like cysteine proteinase
MFIYFAYLMANENTLNFTNKHKYFIKTHYGAMALHRFYIIEEEIFNLQYNPNKLNKLKAVNKLINKFHFKEDIVHWKKDDYWASLIELIGTGAGDGEDFAMAKYFILSHLGFEKNQFKLFINKKNNQIVLGYKHKKDGKYIILNYQTDSITIFYDDLEFTPLDISEQFVNKQYNKMLMIN